MTTPIFFTMCLHETKTESIEDKIDAELKKGCEIVHIKFLYHEGEQYDHYVALVIFKK